MSRVINAPTEGSHGLFDLPDEHFLGLSVAGHQVELLLQAANLFFLSEFGHARAQHNQEEVDDLV